MNETTVEFTLPLVTAYVVWGHLGPWLLAGLIPLVVGSALILGHYLTPGRPGELPPRAGTDHPGGQISPSQERAASSEPASERGEPHALPEPGRHGATEPNHMQRAKVLAARPA